MPWKETCIYHFALSNFFSCCVLNSRKNSSTKKYLMFYRKILIGWYKSGTNLQELVVYWWQWYITVRLDLSSSICIHVVVKAKIKCFKTDVFPNESEKPLYFRGLFHLVSYLLCGVHTEDFFAVTSLCSKRKAFL